MFDIFNNKLVKNLRSELKSYIDERNQWREKCYRLTAEKELLKTKNNSLRYNLKRQGKAYKTKLAEVRAERDEYFNENCAYFIGYHPACEKEELEKLKASDKVIVKNKMAEFFPSI